MTRIQPTTLQKLLIGEQSQIPKHLFIMQTRLTNIKVDVCEKGKITLLN